MMRLTEIISGEKERGVYLCMLMSVNILHVHVMISVILGIWLDDLWEDAALL